MTCLLVTRPEPDASRVAGHLAALGIEATLAPMLEMRPLSATLPEVSGFAAIAATSANAIRCLEARGDAERLAAIPVFAVGDHTAHLAREAGFETVVSAQGTLHDLVDAIAAAGPKGPVLYPAAHQRSGDLGALLAPHGIAVITRVLYEMVPATALAPETRTALDSGAIAGALFYSRRTAQVFAGLCADAAFAPVRAGLECLCISENCAEPLVSGHFVRISLADDPTGESMEALALAFAREQIRA